MHVACKARLENIVFLFAVNCPAHSLESHAMATPKPAVAEKPPEVPPAPPATPVETPPRKTRWWLWLLLVALLIVGGIFGVPWVIRAYNTVSTDDAFVNSHATFVAPRVSGQVAAVLVEDNNRVRKGDLLVQLDKEPLQAQVNIAQAALSAADANLLVAQAQVRATVSQMRSLRFNLDHAIEDVDNQAALLHARVATLKSYQALYERSQKDYDRVVPLLTSGGISQEVVDQRKQQALADEARVEEALQNVYQIRVQLGLKAKPESGDLTEVPLDLNQVVSSVRQAQASLMQAAATVGVSDSFNKTPRQLVVDFYKRDPSGDIDRIYDKIVASAPGIKKADSERVEAQRNLDQALLNLKYCDVRSEIDGVVTRRSVNPGNNVVAGQSLMLVRSLTEIWVDANFKETQLGSLRIGQLVELEADMYGSKQHFKGRISGFTTGTGSTLSLLPTENATGNFVKVVQRLPVRIDLIGYKPDETPLFPGLSVTPTVLLNEPMEGPDAGKMLQQLPSASAAKPAASPPAPSPAITGGTSAPPLAPKQ